LASTISDAPVPGGSGMKPLVRTYKTSKFALPRVDIPDSKLDIWSMEPNFPQDKAKRAAGVQASATYLKNGMKIGLGSGTTSRWFIQTLGDRVKERAGSNRRADIEFDA
jgi:hypothetical protein